MWSEFGNWKEPWWKYVKHIKEQKVSCVIKYHRETPYDVRCSDPEGRHGGEVVHLPSYLDVVMILTFRTLWPWIDGRPGVSISLCTQRTRVTGWPLSQRPSFIKTAECRRAAKLVGSNQEVKILSEAAGKHVSLHGRTEPVKLSPLIWWGAENR